MLVCDESTRIVYGDRSTGLHPEASYERTTFESERVRLSTVQPPSRGVVTAGVALSDSGDSVYFRTQLAIETGPVLG